MSVYLFLASFAWQIWFEQLKNMILPIDNWEALIPIHTDWSSSHCHCLSICFWQEIWFKEITQIWYRLVWQIGNCPLSLVLKCLSLLIHTDWSLSCIHPKSDSPGSPDSANYLNCPQNFSLRTRKLPTLLCWILSQIAKAWKMCQSVVKKQ